MQSRDSANWRRQGERSVCSDEKPLERLQGRQCRVNPWLARAVRLSAVTTDRAHGGAHHRGDAALRAPHLFFSPNISMSRGPRRKVVSHPRGCREPVQVAACAAGGLDSLPRLRPDGRLFIVTDAARHGVAHWWLIPALFLTLMFGPAGLLLYLAMRSVGNCSCGRIEQRESLKNPRSH